jgi:transposase
MYVGVDYHKHYSVATKMDEQGRVVEQVRLRNDPDTLVGYAQRLPQGSKIALEATGSWYYFYEVLEDRGAEIYLAHPLRTRAIASARIKTDKIDSTILAHLLRTDLLPTSYIAPREIRDTREILRYRASLVSLRTSIKNKVHAILAKNGMTMPYTNVFGKKAIGYLQRLKLRPCYRQSLDGYLRLATALNTLIQEISETIEGMVQDDPRAQLLMSIPGISYYSALLIVSEIGDIGRFPSAKKLCSYAGLVPSVHASGGKIRYGAITKQGSKWLRWILVELSYHFTRGSERLQNLYKRVSKSHGKATARVAVAREMLKIIYYMLRDNRMFIRG